MNDEQLLLEKIFLKNPKFGIDLLSSHFGLSHELIDEYVDVLNFKNGVSQNKNVIFNLDFIDKYNNKWNWGILQNNNLPWSLDFIKSHYIRTSNGLWGKTAKLEQFYFNLGWNWKVLVANDNVPWSIELFWEFRDKWGFPQESCFEKIKWTVDSLIQYEDILKKYSNINDQIQLDEPKYFIKSERYPEREIEIWSEFGNIVSKKKNYKSSKKEERKNLIDTTDFLPCFWRYKIKLDWQSVSASKNIEWSIELIEFFEEKWDWDNLSQNNLNWNSNLIAKYRLNWNWNYICANKHITWTENIIFENQNDINWSYLSDTQNLSWSIDLIDCYLDKWDWNSLSKNKKLPWSIEFVDKYHKYWDWESLSRNTELPWSVEFFEKYEKKWNWQSLSINRSLPWTTDFFEKYKEKWDFIELSFFNTNIPLTLEILVKYKDKWDWEFMSENKNLPWSIDFLDSFENYLNWDKVQRKFFFADRYNDFYNYFIWDKLFLIRFIDALLKLNDEYFSFYISSDYRINWDLELIERYKDKIDFKLLSSSNNVPWSKELLQKYKQQWDWSDLSWNRSINFSIELLDQFIELWDWNRLSSNTNLKLTPELINRYKNKWNWKILSHNPTVKWDSNLLNNYCNVLDPTKQIWEQIKLNIDENFVKIVLTKIKNNTNKVELAKLTENEIKEIFNNNDVIDPDELPF